jgi:hypothetical protein
MSLNTQREISNFIEEHGSLTHSLEVPLPVGRRTRESTLGVSEEFAAYSVPIERGYVDLQEWLLREWAAPVDFPR